MSNNITSVVVIRGPMVIVGPPVSDKNLIRMQSRSFNIFNGTVTPGAARHPISTTATKMLNRDWSAQETSHILLGYPLVDSPRRFENLDLRTAKWNNGHNHRGGLGSSGWAFESRPLKMSSDIALEDFVLSFAIGGHLHNAVLVMQT